MWTLRIVLIALGIALVAGIYFYTRRHPPGRDVPRRVPPGEPRDPDSSIAAARRVPPRLPPEAWKAPDATAAAPVEPSPPSVAARAQEPSATAAGAPQGTDASPSAAGRLFSLAVRFPGAGISPGGVTRELIRIGCVPGSDQIYHCADSDGERQFSVANLFEPGVLHPLPPDEPLRGLAFFFQAEPGADAGLRLDRMIGAARECALHFDGHVEDHQHRPFTAARELELKVAAGSPRTGG